MFSSEEEKGYTSSYTTLISEKDAKEAQPNRLNTYIQVLTSDMLLKIVSEHSGGKYTAAQLKDMVQADIFEDSDIIKVTVRADNPEDAYLIANSHSRVAPQHLSSIVEGATMKIIDIPNYSK